MPYAVWQCFYPCEQQLANLYKNKLTFTCMVMKVCSRMATVVMVCGSLGWEGKWVWGGATTLGAHHSVTCVTGTTIMPWSWSKFNSVFSLSWYANGIDLGILTQKWMASSTRDTYIKLLSLHSASIAIKYYWKLLYQAFCCGIAIVGHAYWQSLIFCLTACGWGSLIKKKQFLFGKITEHE